MTLRFTNLNRRSGLRLLLSLFVMLTCSLSYAQSRISGTILDDSGSALPGASVLIKGTSKGTVTDINGEYSLSANPEDVLIFSFIGYTTQEINVGSQTKIDVTLELNAQELTEVVVVGYGTQKRAQVTGAIASIEEEEITAVPVATTDQVLQGRAPGVSVINNGSPGTNPNITIRGLSTLNNNNPLYVVDGIIVSGIGDLNPNDIENIQILKDASTTAVYGSKGSNGVVLITTKTGKSGKVKVDFSTYAGSQWSTKRFDLLNTQQYVQYANDIAAPPRTSDPQYANMLQNDTDWQDEIFQSGLMQNYTLGVSGGGENSTFRISAGYLNQEGIIITTDYERFNLRANSNFTLGKFEFGETLSLALSDQSPETSSGGRSIIEHSIKMPPYLSVRNPDNLGGFQGPNSSIDGQDAANPVRILELVDISNRERNIIGNIYGQYEIIDGLKFKSQLGGEYSHFRFNIHSPSYNDDSDGATGAQPFSESYLSNGELMTVTFTNSLNYNLTLADQHNFEILALTEYVATDTRNQNSSTRNELSDDIEELWFQNLVTNSSTIEYRRVGYLARLNYNFEGKYIFSGSFRRDASSRFGANERWGSFSSISLGWRISDEDFFSSLDFISNLKLRASWGQTGNDNIMAYGYQSLIEPTFFYPIGTELTAGASSAGLANPDLKWETNEMSNIGLDGGLLDDKITFSLEYYFNKGKDILLPTKLPSSSGFYQNDYVRNIGEMETKGFEAMIGYQGKSGDFEWSVSLNLGTSKNEVTSTGPNPALEGASFEGQFITRVQVGEPAFSFYGWQFDGIFQNQAEIEAHAIQPNAEPGDFRIVNTNTSEVNGNQVINDDDRVFIGNPYPKATGGLNISGKYKNFDLSIFVNGVYGNDVYNTNKYDLEGMPRLFNSGTAVLDRWTGEGTSNTVPRALGVSTNTEISSRFVEDGSFTRFRNISIGYTIPPSVFNDKISKFRIYVSGQNLITITDYSGLDPEIGNYSATAPNAVPGAIGGYNTANNFSYGVDFGNYPIAKSIIAGIQIGF
ncbi:TonB-dependent receptor [Fulvivirga maritima]|uniref:SusC/RagA family TonB-linked outer membrane protein n=1 Tax=Fulvivirga maritima TaxID=2904247 RepID=UPI001F2EF7A4|nr:TonB-dependent receptor [Fulvivirga maritima]UII25487.1 TonB-dependent receptor [Fulvivirga maritima]